MAKIRDIVDRINYEQSDLPRDPKYSQYEADYGPGAAMARARRDQLISHYGGVNAFGPETADYNPPAEIAPDIQLQHEMAVQRYNAQLAAQAQGYMRQGLGLFQSYRPGGAASLTTGLYGGLANATLAGQQDSLDLTHEFRRTEAERIAAQARKQQRRAAIATGAGTVIGAGLGAVAGSVIPGAGTAAGAVVGGALGGAVGSAIGGGPAQPADYSSIAAMGQGGGAQQQQPGGPGLEPTTGNFPSQTGIGDLGSGGTSAGFTAGSTIGGIGGDYGTTGAGGGDQVGGGTGGGGGQKQLAGAREGRGGAGAVSVSGSEDGAAGGPGGAAGGGMGGQPVGAFVPLGPGRLGMTSGYAADSYEQRYGSPVDTMWNEYYAHNMLGFGDRMNSRLDALMASG